MASSYVFPGGVANDTDRGEMRVTAARELFEEAGVLLSNPDIEMAVAEGWRPHVDAGDADLRVLLGEAGAELATGRLFPYGHWITPSIEKRRYSARFFVARMPAKQVASPCNRETVDELWVTPAEGLARKGELRLPPPQVRTLLELREAAEAGWADVQALCALRERAPHAILPRMRPLDSGFALLLPWDPEYESHGTGDSLPMPPGHPLATGPSRFVLGPDGWEHVEA